MLADYIEHIHLTSLYILSISLPISLAGASVWWLATRRGKIALAMLFSMLFFSLLDLAMFRSMPYLGLSFGPSNTSVTVVTLVRGLMTVGGATVLIGYLGLRYLWNPNTVPRRSSALYWTVPVLFNLVVTGCLVDGLYFEPLAIQVQQVNVASDRLADTTAPLRIVQLSDTHVERLTRRERDTIRLVNDLHPDLIVLTGDYLNLSYLYDKQSRTDFRYLISQLKARYGIYASWGSVDRPDFRDSLFEGLGVTVLKDAWTTVRVNGQDINLLGIDLRHELKMDTRAFRELAQELPGDGFNILLYHTPDLMPAAVASNKIDLYLAGHTHGGQIRLPIYGAIVTASAWGKRYEAGYYHDGRTTLYVNRGLGFEGGDAPRIRFLCPPEIATFTLAPSGQATRE